MPAVCLFERNEAPQAASACPHPPLPPYPSPFNGVVKVVFASGHVYSWNFTSAMSATDGRCVRGTRAVHTGAARGSGWGMEGRMEQVAP